MKISRIGAVAAAVIFIFIANERAVTFSEPVTAPALALTEEIEFPPLQTKSDAKPVTAWLNGAEHFAVSWRLEVNDPVRMSVASDGAFYFREDGGDTRLRAVLPSGERKTVTGPDERPEDIWPDWPEGISVEGGTVSGEGSNGQDWSYTLPASGTIDSDSVQADAMNRIYFHDDRSNWFAIDTEGRERYSIHWQGDAGSPVCRVTPAGDAACISSALGLIGIREKTEAIRLFIDGTQQHYPKRPVLRDGVTYVPFRPIFEALQAEVGWDDQTRTVEAQKDGRIVRLTVGSVEAEVDGDAVLLEHPPVIEDGTALVPLRFIGEALGVQVYWEGAVRTIQIVTP